MIEDTLTSAPQWRGVVSPESCIVEGEGGGGGGRPKEGLVSNLIS